MSDIKLIIKEIIELPEPHELFFHYERAAFQGGNIVFLGSYSVENEYYYSLIGLEDGIVNIRVLKELGSPLDNYHTPVLFALHEGGFALLHNADTLYCYYSVDIDPVIIKIQPNEYEVIPHITGQLPRTYGISPVSDTNSYDIIFSEPVCVQDNRYTTNLIIDTKRQTAQWGKVRGVRSKKLDEDFLYNEKKCSFNSPIIGSSMRRDNELYLFLEGSDGSSVNKYGMDFYKCLKINESGEETECFFEANALKRDTKKHGVRGIFTSSLDHIILTQVFKSDDWKGQQKIYSLDDKILHDLIKPRGTKDYVVKDYFEGIYWLTNNENKIIKCITDK